MNKKIIKLLFILFIAITSVSHSQTNTNFVQHGEELTYEVSFMGIKLGSIKMIIEGLETYNNTQVLKAKSIIKSYPGIPFVDLDVVFQSWMDSKINYSHKFASNTKNSEGWYYEEIFFNNDKSNIIINGYQNKTLQETIEIKTNKRWSDGLSLFYIARKLLNSNKNVRIPTLMDKDTVNTVINFTGKKEKVKIAAVTYPVRTVYFKGDANWTGIYGMTGAFEGWFSDDEACVPIRAKMKLYVGNVVIELKHWNRSNWGPPK